jgi:hypothetical protein
MKLHEFVKLYTDECLLTMPSYLQNTESDEKSWVRKNLFPEFAETDLSFLAGHAIVIPHAHLRVHERGQVYGEAASDSIYDVIKALSPYDLMFTECTDSPQKRLEMLFAVKDKWSVQELQAQLSMFVEPAQVAKFDAWVAKFTRSCKEKNPYNASVVA